MTKIQIIANIFSFIGSAMMVAIGAIKSPRKIVLAQSIQVCFMGTANLLLGGISGFIVNAVTFVRNIICCFGKFTKYVKVCFIIAQVALTALFGVTDLILWLPVIANCILTWYLDCGDAIKLKLLISLSVIFWAAYDLYLMNYSAFAFDMLTIASNLISAISIRRNDRTKIKTMPDDRQF